MKIFTARSQQKDLVATGQQIEREYGIPIVNKRISITPIAFVGGKACKLSGRLCEHTERVCSSVNVGSTKCGINMDAVKLMGEILLELAE